MQGGQEREPETDRGTHRQHREGAEWREERKRERGKKRTGTVRERENYSQNNKSCIPPKF